MGGYRPGEEKMYRETFLGWFRFACITKNLAVACSDRSIAQRFAACKCGGEATLMFSEFGKHGSVLSKRATRQIHHIWLIGIAGNAGHWAKGKPLSAGKGVNFNGLLPYGLEWVDVISSALDQCAPLKVYKAA